MLFALNVIFVTLGELTYNLYTRIFRWCKNLFCMRSHKRCIFFGSALSFSYQNMLPNLKKQSVNITLSPK